MTSNQLYQSQVLFQKVHVKLLKKNVKVMLTTKSVSKEPTLVMQVLVKHVLLRKLKKKKPSEFDLFMKHNVY